MIAAYPCVCKSKEIYDLRYKSNKFQYIPNFWEWVLIKISEIICSSQAIASLF